MRNFLAKLLKAMCDDIFFLRPLNELRLKFRPNKLKQTQAEFIEFEPRLKFEMRFKHG